MIRFYRFCRRCGYVTKGVCVCGCTRSFVVWIF